jgi:hypothetical protein
MEDTILDIMGLLEARKAAIDRALVALREINDDTPPAWVTGNKPAASPAKRKGFKRTAAQRRKMAESQRLRFARQRGEA